MAFDSATSRIGTAITVGALSRLRSVASLLGGARRATQLDLATHRLSLRLQRTPEPTWRQRNIETRLREALTAGRLAELARPPRGVDFRAEFDQRGLVLKEPIRAADGTVLERGVFLLTFTHLFGAFAETVDVRRFTGDYTLVLEPSWSGYAHAEILQFAGLSPTPVFVEATEPRDRAFLERWDPVLRPLPFGASNWVDPEVFTPVPEADRPFDVGMIGFWGVLKRHHALFRALRALWPERLRVALIGGAWEGTRHEIAALARSYGVLDQLTLFEGLTPGEVAAVIGRCKVSALLSRKEGSNRGLFESMFAGTPALLLKENLGVCQDYINAATGRLVHESELSEALLWMRDHWRAFTPRAWALEHLAPTVTTALLNDTLAAAARSAGEPWTVDCVPKVNRPEVTYLHPRDRDRFPPASQLMASYPRSS